MPQRDAYDLWSSKKELTLDLVRDFFNDVDVFGEGDTSHPNAVQVWTEAGAGALLLGGRAKAPTEGYVAMMAGTRCCLIEGSEVTDKCGSEFPHSCGAPSGTTHEVVRLKVEALCTAERAGLAGAGLELATRTCASLDSFLSPELEASPEAAPEE